MKKLSIVEAAIILALVAFVVAIVLVLVRDLGPAIVKYLAAGGLVLQW